MTERTRIGVLGGTFDPIHVGHLAAAEDAAYRLRLARVLVVPNNRPPHKQSRNVSSPSDRAAMAGLAIADNPLFTLSMVELDRPGLSFTLDTMRELQQEMGEAELYFLTGCDALPALHTWHEPEALLDEFRVVILDRPTRQAIDWSEVERHFPRIREQITVLPVARLEISSEDVRNRVQKGAPIRYYVLPQVEQYIRQKGLYLED